MVYECASRWNDPKCANDATMVSQSDDHDTYPGFSDGNCDSANALIEVAVKHVISDNSYSTTD